MKMAESMFDNKLFLQYLAAAGNDISSGGGLGAGINAVTQQNISAQNFAKLLKTVLGPDGTKATLSNAGINLTVPKETALFKSMLGEGDVPFQANMSLDSAASAPIVPTQEKQVPTPNGGSPVLNPFVEGQPNTGLNVSGPDLAGLSPKDIASAIGLKQNQEELKSKTIAQIQDMAYKTSLMENIKSEIDTRTPRFEIPGVGKVIAKQYIDWQKLMQEKKPNEAKLYEYAIGQGFKGSFIDFENRTQTAHKKDYDEAVKSGYSGDFNTWMLSMAKAGAINLGDKVAEKKAFSELQGQDYFNNPDWTKDIEKTVQAFDKEQAWLIPEEQRPLARAKTKVKAIEDKISAGGGAVQKVVMDKDGKTMIWTVKWPTGDIKIVKQAVK